MTAQLYLDHYSVLQESLDTNDTVHFVHLSSKAEI